MKFRILHTESALGRGGQEIRTIVELELLQKRGHKVCCVAQPGSYMADMAKEKNIPLFEIKFRNSIDLIAMYQLAGIIKKEKIDIMNTHSSLDSWVGGQVGRIMRLPLIVRTRHVSLPIKNKLVYTHFADLIITAGKAIKEMLEYKYRISGEKIFSIPTGIDLFLFDPSKYDRQKIRRELGIDDSLPFIGIIGIIRWCKGHDIFLEAAKKVLIKYPDAKFAVVGDDPDRKIDFQNIINSHGLGQKVFFLGFRRDIPDILSSLDIVVSSSTAAEGVSQSIIQALAMEKGLVATDVGSTNEVVKDNSTGILVDPGDPTSLADGIIRLLENRHKITKYGKEGRKMIVKNFNIESMISKTEELYRRFLENKK